MSVCVIPFNRKFNYMHIRVLNIFPQKFYAFKKISFLGVLICTVSIMSLVHGHPRWLNGKESVCNAGDTGDPGSIPGSGRSPGGGHGNPLQYSCLRIPWTEEAGGPQSMGLQRVRHDLVVMFMGHLSCQV